MPHGRFPLWQLLRRNPEVAHPQCRDIAPLRLVSWLSCEVPDQVQQVLNQLMTLFGAVTPVSSNEVINLGLKQLRLPAGGEPSWDMIRDALIRGVTIGGNTCPTEEVGCLMVSFLQRLPLPRLIHFLDMILPQMVPVQSPCHSRRRRFASSYRIEERLARGEHGVEYPLHVTKLFWSRSNIMHVAIAWDCKPLLLLTTALLPNRTAESFQMEAGPPYDKQRIQMGLRKGNTVLICFRSGVVHYQCVLIALAADLSNSKPRLGQRKFWRYVSPLRTYFAWLPYQLAFTYCRAALEMHPRIPYGEVHHLQGQKTDFQHSMVFQNIYHIGDTKSAQELEVFLRMPRERLRLCCGIQCTDSLHPNGPLQRRKLYTAALKLLRFAVGIETVCCENDEQRALQQALLPLLRLDDGHVLATLSAIVLALCEGSTGLAISGVFGAGKTRSAAALLAGLLVFDPSLHLMVLTKENVVHMQLLSIWCPCSSLITFKVKWDVWLVTMSNIAKALTLLWTFFLRTETRLFDRNRSSLDAEVVFNKNVGNPLAPLLTGWVLWTSFWRMKGNNMGTWKRQPLLQEHQLLVLKCGLATTGKRQVALRRARRRKPFRRNSPSALWH